jgi:hypothetical protein
VNARRPEQAASKLNAGRFQRCAVAEVQTHVVKHIGERAAVDVPHQKLSSTRLRVGSERLECPRRRSTPKQRESSDETERERY